MDCPNCHSANEGNRRFCRECGAPLGNLCKRCNHLGPLEDKFCANCGNSLAVNSQERLFSPPEQPDKPRQYSPEEIQDLLSLRKVARQEEAASAKVSQSDVDSIFG